MTITDPLDIGPLNVDPLDVLRASLEPNATTTAGVPQNEPSSEVVSNGNGSHAKKSKRSTSSMASFTYRSADGIAPEKPKWLWKLWLLDGALNILSGQQSAGKSTWAAFVVSRVTTGRALDGDEARKPIKVGWLSFEESGNAIVSKLTAAGADLGMVTILDDVEVLNDEGHAIRRPWSMPGDVSVLEDAIVKHGLEFVVVDGIGYSIRGDTKDYGTVGTALSSLAMVAERTKTAILGLTHVRKGSSEAVTASIGSTAWTAIPRIGIVLGRNPHDETGSLRVVRVAKTGYREPATGYEFTISEDEQLECGYITELVPSDVLADEITDSSLSAGDKSTRASAIEIIRSLVEEEGRATDADMQKALRSAGIETSPKTLQRVRKALGLVSQRSGFGVGSTMYWSFPSTLTANPESTESAEPPLF